MRIRYDAFDRMVEWRDVATGLRNAFAYDCFHRRIETVLDADGVLSRGLFTRAGDVGSPDPRASARADVRASDDSHRVDEVSYTGTIIGYPRQIDEVSPSGTSIAGPVVTRYFYGGPGQWRVVEEQDGAGAATATYVHGPYVDEVLAMRRDVGGDGTPEDYFFHRDDLYNVVAASDAGGAIVERYEYGDFGLPEFRDAAGRPVPPAPPGTSEGSLYPGGRSSIGNPYLFTGRRFDPPTGLYYYRTRYLDPIAGRFTTRDRIGIWGDFAALGNGFAYAGDNPATWLDPFGEEVNPADFDYFAEADKQYWRQQQKANDLHGMAEQFGIWGDAAIEIGGAAIMVAGVLIPDPTDAIWQGFLAKEGIKVIRKGGKWFLEKAGKILDRDSVRKLKKKYRRERKATDKNIEDHHNLPKEFRWWFEKEPRNMDIEDFVLPLPAEKHRRLPHGIHTGKDHWNKEWREYIDRHRDQEPTEKDVIEELERMWRRRKRCGN